MVCSYNSKRCFIVISNSLLLSQRAGKGACDVTGRDPKSLIISNNVLFCYHMNSIHPKTISFKQIFRHYHNVSSL